MSGYSHPAPRYRISLGGADITDRLRDRLISLTLTDNRGTEADQHVGAQACGMVLRLALETDGSAQQRGPRRRNGSTA